MYGKLENYDYQNKSCKKKKNATPQFTLDV